MRIFVAVVCLLGAGSGASATPIELAEAIRTARRAHPDARAAQALLAAARADAGVALAGYLPHLDLFALGRADYSNFTPVVVGTAASGGLTTFPFTGSQRYSASVALTQLVFDGGRTLAQLGTSRARSDVATEDLAAQELAIEATVTIAYFGVLDADGQVGVATEYEQKLRALAESMRRLVTGGVRPELDATTAENRAQRALIERVRAQGTAKVRRAALIAALGLDADPGFTLLDAFTAPVAEEQTATDELVGRALSARPELRSLEGELRVAKQQLRAARSDYFPTAGLTLAGTMTGTNGPPLFDFFASLTMSQSIFAGLATYRASQSARASLEVVRARIASLRVDVRRGVAGAAASLEAAREVELQTGKLVEVTERLVQSAQKRYDAGLVTALELFDAQAQRAVALGQRVTARYALALGRAELRRAVGGTIVDGLVAR